MTVTPSTEEARLRRELKALADGVERILYTWGAEKDWSRLREIANKARTAATPPHGHGGQS